MTLQINIDKLAGPGRRPLDLEYEVIRDMTEADIVALSSVDLGSAPDPIKKLTDRHHALARLLAQGTSQDEAALILNYDVSRVSNLKNSPAFIELLAFYRKDVQREYVTTHKQLAGLARDAVMELRERLEEEPEKFSVNELLRISTETYDRSNAEEEASERNKPVRIELISPEVASPEEKTVDDSTD